MKVTFVDGRTGDKFSSDCDFKEEEKMIENLINKGFRPIKGDFIQELSGHGDVYEIEWIVISDENTITIAIDN